MVIEKPHSVVPKEWLWDYGDGEREVDIFDGVGKTSLLFGIFYIDKFSPTGATHLKDLLRRSYEHFKLWNDYYPWSESNGISMSLEIMDDGTQFIYGQVCVEDNVREEEFLVSALLVQLSLDLGPQVFIRICDTDGDFIMTEASHEELESPMTCNRLWLNCGEFKLIPSSDSGKFGVSPPEALEFLKNSYFKCVDLDSVKEFINTKVMKGFPEKYLSNLVKLTLVIEKTENRLKLLENPQLISYLLKSLNDQEVKESEPSTQEGQIEVIVPKELCNLIPFFLKAKGLSKDPRMMSLLCGRAVSSVLDDLSEKGLLIDSEAKTKASPRRSIFDPRNFEKASIDFNITENPEFDLTNELTERLNVLLKEEIKIDDKASDEDLRSTEDPDYECRKYFQNEEIDIDEDDFFEFFLKEGLSLSEAKIDELRTDEGGFLETYDKGEDRCNDKAFRKDK